MGRGGHKNKSKICEDRNCQPQLFRDTSEKPGSGRLSPDSLVTKARPLPPTGFGKDSVTVTLPAQPKRADLMSSGGG